MYRITLQYHPGSLRTTNNTTRLMWAHPCTAALPSFQLWLTRQQDDKSLCSRVTNETGEARNSEHWGHRGGPVIVSCVVSRSGSACWLDNACQPVWTHECLGARALLGWHFLEERHKKYIYICQSLFAWKVWRSNGNLKETKPHISICLSVFNPKGHRWSVKRFCFV